MKASRSKTPTRLGVRGRLLLAFFGISAFSLVAAIAAFYSFSEVSSVLDQVSGERMPTALSSLELSREAERIVTAAPALLAASRPEQYEQVSSKITAEALRLDELLGNLTGSSIPADMLAVIEARIDGLRQNLRALDALVGQRILLGERLQERLHQLDTAGFQAKLLIEPGLVMMDSRVAKWRREQATGQPGTALRDEALLALAADITGFVPQQKAQIEITAITDNLIKSAATQSGAQLPLLRLPMRRSLASLEQLVGQLDPRLQPRLRDRIEDFRALIDGPESIVELRSEELAIVGQGERLIAENAELSQQLTQAVDRLVADAGEEVVRAKQDVSAVQRGSSAVLVGAVLLSLLCSSLIVWLYVGRNLIRRLTGLSTSMMAVAGGNLRVPLPVPRRNDEIDEMARALSVFRDTAVEIEDKKLRELYLLLETIDYGVLLLEPDLRLRIHNRAYREMSGISEVFMATRPSLREILEFNRQRGIYDVPDEAWDGYVRERTEAITKGGASRTEFRLRTGQVIEFQCRRLPDGGHMLTYYDLTHLKQTEQALVAAKEEADAAREDAETAREEAEEANRAKSDFLASMSHELRTPMNAIIGFSRLVMHRSKDVLPARQLANLGRIQNSADHLLALINDILDLSKIEARRMDVQPVEFAVAPLIGECLRTVESMIRSDQVRLVEDIQPDLPALLQDQDKVRQILINLLSNAVKFTEAGTITIRASACGDTAALAVADTGIGIPDDAQARVFEEFGQVGGSNTRQRGTGLGLAISRRLASLLGGDLSLRSTLGQGSTFTLTLPVRYARAPANAPPDRPPDDGSATSDVHKQGRRRAVSASSW